MLDYYRILGVAQDADYETLKKVAPSEAWGRGTSHGDMN
jgi:hypothetical protein